MVNSQPSSFTQIDTSPIYPLGQIVTDPKDDKRYMYVQNAQASGGSNLDPTLICGWSGATGRTLGKVDLLGATVRGPAGMPLAAITPQNYGWIQVKGSNASFHTSGTVAMGQTAMIDTANAGQVKASDGTLRPVAVNDAAADVAAGTGKTLRLILE